MSILAAVVWLSSCFCPNELSKSWPPFNWSIQARIQQEM